VEQRAPVEGGSGTRSEDDARLVEAGPVRLPDAAVVAAAATDVEGVTRRIHTALAVNSMREAANESAGSHSSALDRAASQPGSGTASLLSSAT